MKSRIVFGVSLIILFLGCTNPTEPEFDIKTGLMSVEGFVSNFEKSSYAKIYRLNEFNSGLNNYVNVFESNAEVKFVNTSTNQEVTLVEDAESELYLPPLDFVAEEGDTWQLYVKLENGTEYSSTPEVMSELVPISEANVEYHKELEYVASEDKFVPGHQISVNVNDPSVKGDFYYWSYRTYELNTICAFCEVTEYFRNGKCIAYIDPETTQILPPYFTYYCESDCWQIRYNSRVHILADEFINGTSFEMPVGKMYLYNKKPILVELQQYSISAAAYKYFSVLKDIVEDNSSLNSPPPAALIGNIFNPNNEDEVVLGRFTVAGASEKRIFVSRDGIKESELEPTIIPLEETAPIAESQRVYEAPCYEESRYLTYTEPEGWK